MKLIIYAAFLIFGSSLLQVTTADCFIQNTCYDEGSDKTYENKDFWYSAEKKCYGCLCVEHKEYVLSCMEATGSNKTSTMRLPDGGILSQIIANVPYAYMKTEKTLAMEEESVEITEDDAMHIECSETPKPQFDAKSKLIHYPELKLVHYMFVTRQSFCCRKAAIPTNVHPFCRVKETGRCSFEVVMKRNPKRHCKFPYTLS